MTKLKEIRSALEQVLGRHGGGRPDLQIAALQALAIVAMAERLDLLEEQLKLVNHWLAEIAPQ